MHFSTNRNRCRGRSEWVIIIRYFERSCSTWIFLPHPPAIFLLDKTTALRYIRLTKEVRSNEWIGKFAVLRQ